MTVVGRVEAVGRLELAARLIDVVGGNKRKCCQNSCCCTHMAFNVLE